MNGQLAKEVEATANELDRVSPNYQAWEEIFEGRPSAIDSILRFLEQRKRVEIWVILSQAGLVFLGRETLLYGGAMGPSLQATCFIVIVILTFFSPAFHHFYHRAAEDGDDAEEINGAQDPP